MIYCNCEWGCTLSSSYGTGAAVLFNADGGLRQPENAHTKKVSAGRPNKELRTVRTALARPRAPGPMA